MEILGVLDVPVYQLLTALTVVLLYIYSTWNHRFFKRHGIPGPRPYPFVGNTLGKGLWLSFHQWRQTYGNAFGIFMGREPVFVISDLDILKEVFVKSFNTFRNRRKQQMVAYPFNLGVFFLEDAAWKRVRNIITPTFSGSKLRAMSPAIIDCTRTLVNNLRKTFNHKSSVDMKEYFGAYTMDVIARTAFGVQVDSQNNLNDPFISHAKKIFAPNKLRAPIFILTGMFPFLVPILEAFGVSTISKYILDFFTKNITEMIKEREMDPKEVRENRSDFLQLLMDAEIHEGSEAEEGIRSGKANASLPDKQTVRRLTTDEIVGQGILFFLAGYETTASTLNFASFVLATHPDVQEKVYQEIRDELGDKDPDYDNIGKLRYLENVINETLRLYPPFFATHRRASETITIKGITIPKDFTVFIPILSIQRDPNLFQDAEDFKPERFDEKINPLSLLSFGYGPRICIAMRLALVEVKIALIHLVKTVKLETAPDTPEKLSFNGINTLQLQEPNMLKVSPR